MKLRIVKPDDEFKAGQEVEATGAQAAALIENGLAVTASEWEATQAVVKAREAKVDEAFSEAVKAGRFLPKEDTTEIKATALAMEQVKAGSGAAYVASFPVKVQPEPVRATSSTEPKGTELIKGSLIQIGELGLRDTVKACLVADEPFRKTLRNGGIVRAAHMDPHLMAEAMEASRQRSLVQARLAHMVANGADLSREDVVRAAAAAVGDFESHNSTNGALNTGLLIQWNLGFLANQLAPIADITVDLSGQPVLFNQPVRTRYISVPGVMLKSTSNAWSSVGPASVDVNVTMDTHAGVPIAFDGNTLASTPRQLFNEQRTPQLYGLGEYLIYKLIYTAFNGSTRLNNAGTTTSTITFNPAYTNGGGTHTFSVAGASLATFTADLPEAMDESKFPGGDEEPGDTNLQRFAWVHGRVYASAAADTNFLINQSIWGAVAKTGENLVETGRFSRLGNIKFRKSQLVTDQCSVSGAGATGGDPITVSAGTYASATKVGLCGTRNSLLFVSRVPLDYTKVLPDIPSTAAIEMATEPKTGLTFLIVKYLDHAYETANLRCQLMFGTAIGDERQGMILTK